jgi:lysophospholipase L1-like esterase
MVELMTMRRIATVAALGGGGLGAAGALVTGVLLGQALIARRTIAVAQAPPPRCDGDYGTEHDGPPMVLAMLGDSSAAGYGVEVARHTTGALLAAGLAERFRRPVTLHCLAVVGAESRDLAPQVERVLPLRPHAVVLVVGGNDVTHRRPIADAVGYLVRAVRALRDGGVEVVVGTCPDLGTIRPIQPPLRWMARRWSRRLATAQTIAVVEAGGSTVSLGDLLGPAFAAEPERMFGADRFHPSADGYAAAAAAILPTLAAALGGAEEARLGFDEGVRSLPEAAAEAADHAGTEVSRARVAGRERGPAGRWAQLRRRVGRRTEHPTDPHTAEPHVPWQQERAPDLGGEREKQR